MTKVKMVKLGRKGQVVIPKEIREVLGLKEGDRLLVGLEGNRVVLTAPGEYAKRTRGALRGLWGGKDEVEKYLEEERASWD